MKILNIKQFDKEKIVVEVEGYPHAQPVFPDDITEKELKTKLAEWKVNQDEVDLINSQAKEETKEELSPSLKALEGKEI